MFVQREKHTIHGSRVCVYGHAYEVESVPERWCKRRSMIHAAVCVRLSPAAAMSSRMSRQYCQAANKQPHNAQQLVRQRVCVHVNIFDDKKYFLTPSVFARHVVYSVEKCESNLYTIYSWRYWFNHACVRTSTISCTTTKTCDANSSRD